MAVFVALLRAVNVGGTGKLPMKELKSRCEEVGLRSVSTYIASGNLVFESSGSAAASKALIARVLSEYFGLTKNHTLIRTVPELTSVIAQNPFSDAASVRPNWLTVHFLDGAPPAGMRNAFEAFEGPERVHVKGEHLYIDYCTGAGRSKLTPAYIERMVKVSGTSRNWNTTVKLLDMARALEQQPQR